MRWLGSWSPAADDGRSTREQQQATVFVLVFFVTVFALIFFVLIFVISFALGQREQRIDAHPSSSTFLVEQQHLVVVTFQRLARRDGIHDGFVRRQRDVVRAFEAARWDFTTRMGSVAVGRNARSPGKPHHRVGAARGWCRQDRRASPLYASP